MAATAETPVESFHRAPSLEAELTSATRGNPSVEMDMQLAVLNYEAGVKAGQLARSVGRMAITPELAGTEVTLYDAIRAGNRALIAENARTDVLERTFKAGHVMKVRQSIDAKGNIVQHGQSSEQIQANTLRYANDNPLMKQRTIAETKNMYYIDSLRRGGLLKDNYAVVVSLCPDADDATLDALGFFAFSKSLVIQATTEEAGGVTTESAFIAGVTEDGTDRYDHEVAVAFGEQFDEDWRGLDDAEIISRVLLVPKSRIKNGVIELAELWDDLAGGTFFGMSKPRQDYMRYLEICRQREKEFEPKVEKIVADLLSVGPALRNPLDATAALDKISEKHMLDQALVDHSIDPRVFGAKAAISLAEARFHLERGNMQLVSAAMSVARTEAQSGSCPSGGSSKGSGKWSLFNEDGTLKTPEELMSEQDGKDEEETDEHGALTFYCTEGHRNTRKRGELLTTCQTKPCKPGSVGCETESLGNKVETSKPSGDELVEQIRRLFRTAQTEPAARAEVALAA